MPALTRNGAGVFHTPVSLGPLTTNPPGTTGGSDATLTVTRSGNALTIGWTPVGGALESSTSLGPNATWQTVGTTNPATVQIGTEKAVFYRVRQ
jgi:hypothetical protein